MSQEIPHRTPTLLAGEKQICLYLGGSLDGGRYLTDTSQDRVCITLKVPSQGMHMDWEDHVYLRQIFTMGGDAWCIYVSQEITVSEAFQRMFDAYGKDAKAPADLVDKESLVLDTWDLPAPGVLYARPGVIRRTTIDGGPPYTLWVWYRSHKLDVKVANADERESLTKEVNRYINEGQDAWITDRYDNVVAGASCMFCNSRANLHTVVYQDGRIDFVCGIHYGQKAIEVMAGAKSVTSTR